ncbi:MAG: 1-phosphofructokinase family hexose kinase [Bacteroidetes bacterium]|nr:1-phosphofructokinase family hexose kinase [Bacteroidota bacterium]
MSKIITVTLNPAIDKSTFVDVLVPEKKMKCAKPFFEPGGGGVNVARAIRKLGGDATAVYLAGGYTGKFYRHLLDEEKIQSIVVEIAQHTRENLIVQDRSSNLQYRFGMPGPVISEPEWKMLLAELEKIENISYLVASGSVPEGIPTDIFARIAKIAKKKNARFIADTSGEALKHAADEGVYLLKPNLRELSSLAGKEELNMELVNKVANEILSTKKCEVLIVSTGESGALLFTRDFSRQITPPVVKRKSTVGAGDSMVGGIVYSLSQGNDLFEAVQFGVACGTAATMNWGTQLCKKEDAEKIFEMIKQFK